MNKELIKEKIAWYKLLFTVLVTLTVVCTGWFVANYFNPVRAFVVIDIIFIIVFLTGIIASITKIRFYFKKLGENKNV